MTYFLRMDALFTKRRMKNEHHKLDEISLLPAIS